MRIAASTSRLLHRLAAFQPAPQAGQRGLRGLHAGRVAGDRDAVAAARQPHAEPLLDPHQVAVVVAEQQRQQRIVGEVEGDGLAGGRSVPGRAGGTVDRGRGDVAQARALLLGQGCDVSGL